MMAMAAPHAVALEVEPEESIVVINEVMINPDAVSDSRGEWIELYNSSSNPVSLLGWTVTDGKRDMFIIDEDIVISPDGYVVLARCSDPLRNGGVHADFEYSGMYLANGGDAILIFDKRGAVHDALFYSEERGFTVPCGASLEVKDPFKTNTPSSQWAPSTSVFGDGDHGTPGTCNSWYVPPNPVQRPPRGALFFLFKKGILPVDDFLE